MNLKKPRKFNKMKMLSSNKQLINKMTYKNWKTLKKKK